MDNINVERKTSEWSRTRRRKKAWQRVLAGMMAVVVFSTTYALILPAITKEQEVFCGQAEHEHTEACYERVLICGYPAEEQGASLLLGGTHAAQALEGEAADAGAGDPTDLVASDDGILTPPAEAQNDSVIEDAEPTEPTDDAQRAAEGVGPYEATTPAPDPHVHTDECYELQLKCELEAHAHGLACFSNPEADLEDAESWTRSVAAVELSGDWAADLVAIAESQLGNGESENNYAVNENGEKAGYTRYGAWWAPANAYDPWCAMFVSFCLDFAKVDKELFPQYAGCAQWQGELEARGLWREAAFYSPAPGDVIFFDYDFDALADHVGLVAEISEEALKTIEGNNSTKVEQFIYEPKDERILGYGVLPVNPAAEGDVTPAPAGEGEGRAVEDAGPYEGTAAQNEEIVRLSTEAAGVKITLTGPKSSLPWPIEELELWASPVIDPAAVALIEEGLETPAGMTRRTLLFDIRIYHNGVEVQPEGDVLVRFGGVEVPNNDAQVFYVDPETETVEEETVKQGKETLSFETDHFSIRGITYTTQNIGDAYVPGAASVTALSLRTVTGTEIWDGDDNDGNDSGPDNDLVRSFDTIFYNVGYTLNLNERYAYLQQQGRFKGFTTARLYVRASLPLTEDKAIFDKSAMPWLHVLDEVSDLTHQEIFGYYELTAGALDYIVPSAGTLRFAVYVKGMQDTDKDATSLIQPTLQVFLDQGSNNAYYSPTAIETVTPPATKVSSKPSYNVEIENLITMHTARGGVSGFLLDVGFAVSQTGTSGEKGLRGTYLDMNSASFIITPYWDKGTTSYTNLVRLVNGQTDGTLLWNYDYIDDGEDGLLPGRPLYDGVQGARNVVLGQNSLPYSNSYLRSQGDPENTLYQSGDTTRADHGMTVAFVQNYGYRVTLNGIASDGLFPEKSADRDLQLHVGRRYLASGLVQFFIPLSKAQFNQGTEVAGHIARVRLTNFEVNGSSCADSDSTDNAYDWTATTSRPGGHAAAVNFHGSLCDPPVLGARANGDRAALYRGREYIFSTASEIAWEGLRDLSGGDFFVKFAANFWEVPDNPVYAIKFATLTEETIVSDPSVYVLKYVASPFASGDSWVDSEMWNYHMTLPSHFVLFDTLEELEQSGKVCCGLWIRVRNLGYSTLTVSRGNTHSIRAMFKLKLREDAPIGQVSHILSEQRLYMGSVPPASFNGTETLPDAIYYNFDISPTGTYGVPPLYLVTNPSVCRYVFWCGYGLIDGEWDARGYPVGGYNNWHVAQGLDNSIPQWSAVTGPLIYPWGARAGDSIRVLGDAYIIGKAVAQESAPGVPRGSFMVDRGETLVDYVLSPASNGGEIDRVVTVTDTLPAQMKYVPGSAYLGGDYTQPANLTSSGDHSGTAVPDDGSWLNNVTVCEGKTGRVKLVVSADGRTLTWTLEGVDSGKEMPKLYYSAEIQVTGNPLTDPQDKQQLVNTATITYVGNITEFSEELGNKATATITVQKLDSSTLIKKVEQPVVGQDEVIRYRIEYTNDSPNPVGNVIIRDILPYDTDLSNDAPDGDPRGTKLHGSYVVNSVTVEKADGNVAGTWSVKTTTDTSVRAYHNDLFNNVAFKDLSYAPFTANSSPTMLEITGTEVGAYAKITATIAIKPTGSQDTDIFYNDAAVDAYVDPNGTTRAIPAPVYAAPVHAEVAVDTVELTVKKTVLVGDKTKAFPIRVSWTDGAATTTEELQLKDGETGTLTIPVGANVTITETEHPGYTVLIKEGSQTLARGDSYTIQSIAAARSIEVENTAGAPLPNSGGLGTALPVAFGLMTMAGALCVGLARRRRRSF